jgi:hypothetical protein
MVVSPALLESALNDPQRAIAMVNTFSHSLLAPPPSSLGPGTWLYGSSRALMRRVLASNRDANVFHIGFKACNDYANGEAAMEAVQCPVLFLLGDADQMTPPRATKALVGKARRAQGGDGACRPFADERGAGRGAVRAARLRQQHAVGLTNQRRLRYSSVTMPARWASAR